MDRGTLAKIANKRIDVWESRILAFQTAAAEARTLSDMRHYQAQESYAIAAQYEAKWFLSKIKEAK